MKAQAQVSIWIAIALLMTITACSDNSVTTPSPAAFFPQQRDAKPDSMDALLVGELVLADGCLRVNDSDGNSLLLIWPRDFSLRTDNDVIQIVDGSGQLVAQVGDRLQVAGGEVPRLTEAKVQPLPDNCPGPYWIVGNQITR